MAFSISEFKAHVLTNGFLKSNLYEVWFYSPRFDYKLQFYTESVVLPAIDLETATIHRYGYGPSDQYAYRPVFTTLSIDFMVEASAGRNALTDVMNAMGNIANFMGYNSINTPAYTGANPYEMEYKQNYAFDLEIKIYNEKEDQITSYFFRDCFARQIGSIQLGWGLNDQLLRLPVTFVYTDYSISQYNFTRRDTDTSTNTQNLPGGQYPSPTVTELTSI